LLAALLLVAAATASASAADRQRDVDVGHIYLLNNSLTSPNSISVFARAADGAVHPEGSVPTGGTGPPAGVRRWQAGLRDPGFRDSRVGMPRVYLTQETLHGW
jgi:hypothetical protein